MKALIGSVGIGSIEGVAHIDSVGNHTVDIIKVVLQVIIAIPTAVHVIKGLFQKRRLTQSTKEDGTNVL
jgi:hypothetical protein